MYSSVPLLIEANYFIKPTFSMLLGKRIPHPPARSPSSSPSPTTFHRHDFVTSATELVCMWQTCSISHYALFGSISFDWVVAGCRSCCSVTGEEHIHRFFFSIQSFWGKMGNKT